MKLGHQVIHFVFPEYKSPCRAYIVPNVTTVNLDNRMLEIADTYLQRANNTLKRYLPNKKYKRDTLRRNYYQIKWTNAVYAIGNWEKEPRNNKIEGGTAWACEMYLNEIQKNVKQESRLYFFEQDEMHWYHAEVQKDRILWNRIGAPPSPKGHYTAIGTGFLSEEGKSEIVKTINNF